MHAFMQMDTDVCVRVCSACVCKILFYLFIAVLWKS